MIALGAESARSTVCSLLIFVQLIFLGIAGAIVYIFRPLILKQSNLAAPQPADDDAELKEEDKLDT